jgi:hypothetical protein
MKEEGRSRAAVFEAPARTRGQYGDGQGVWHQEDGQEGATTISFNTHFFLLGEMLLISLSQTCSGRVTIRPDEQSPAPAVCVRKSI